MNSPNYQQLLADAQEVYNSGVTPIADDFVIYNDDGGVICACPIAAACLAKDHTSIDVDDYVSAVEYFYNIDAIQYSSFINGYDGLVFDEFVWEREAYDEGVKARALFGPSDHIYDHI